MIVPAGADVCNTFKCLSLKVCEELSLTEGCVCVTISPRVYSQLCKFAWLMSGGGVGSWGGKGCTELCGWCLWWGVGIGEEKEGPAAVTRSLLCNWGRVGWSGVGIGLLSLSSVCLTQWREVG